MKVKYCPVCYAEFETEDDRCPQCGAALEEPMTEEESEEYLEMLHSLQV